MNTIYLIDVTNRDGVQTSLILLSKLAKTMLNIYLDEMGMFQSKIGFPTLKHEINYINANLEIVKKGVIKQRPLPDDELRFIARHPALICKILTVTPEYQIE